MKKTTKGAIAAGGAAVLLMGGAGTLAYWTSTQTTPGTSFTTGHLSLDATATPCSGWVLDKGIVGKEAPYVAQILVPGETLTNTCTYTVSATGDQLSATLASPNAVASGSLTTATGVSLPVTTTYKLNGTTIGASTPITSADNSHALAATYVVSFPFGTADAATPGTNGNATQDKAASLADISVTLTQVDNH